MIELIEKDEAIEIRPFDIDINNKTQIGCFGKSELEQDALWIVKFCIERGSWSPFFKKDFLDFYHKQTGSWDFEFRGLIHSFEDFPYGGVSGGGYLFVDSEEKIFISVGFVERVCRM